jgi:hypothetical protein
MQRAKNTETTTLTEQAHYFDPASMGRDDPLHHRQSERSSFADRLRREERFKDERAMAAALVESRSNTAVWNHPSTYIKIESEPFFGTSS